MITNPTIDRSMGFLHINQESYHRKSGSLIKRGEHLGANMFVVWSYAMYLIPIIFTQSLAKVFGWKIINQATFDFFLCYHCFNWK